MLTALMVAVTAYWTWQIWNWLNVNANEVSNLQRREYKNTEMLVSTLYALNYDGRLSPDELGLRFTPVLHTSSYRFLILLQDNNVILQVGAVPDTLPLLSEETAFRLDSMIVFSRKISSPWSKPLKNVQNQTGLKRPGSSGLTGQECLLVLGRPNPPDPRQNRKIIEHLVAPFTAVVLLLCINGAVWKMVIRNRSLFEQLGVERARAAHLEELGLAAAGLAHETRNPLGLVSGIAQQVARDPAVPEKSRALLESIVDEIDKSISRLGLFMTFARRRIISVVSMDAAQIIEGVADIMAPEFDAAGVRLDISVPELAIVADEQMFRQILVNLLMNSLTASSPGDVVTIRLTRHEQHATMEVEDQGCGIPGNLLPRIFKPYVTGTPEGHGLGLAIVKRYAEDLDWQVNACSKLNQGTVIRISNIVISKSTGGAA